jgi:hypothetical protein
MNSIPMIHAKDVLCFERMPDGSVKVFVERDMTVIASVTIDSGTWCSVMAAMSPAGETSETWELATELHERHGKVDDHE